MVAGTSRDARVVPCITTVTALSDYEQFFIQMLQTRHMIPEATGNAARKTRS